jgi:predicted GNAT family N-acyltransferase
VSPEAIAVQEAQGNLLNACLALRRRVFVDEQGVDPVLEFDGFDPTALHFAAHRAGILVGTARMRAVDSGVKAERVAVLPEARRCGVGRALMTCLQRAARRSGAHSVVLNAQEGAAAFYQDLGYEITGARFEEAGIPHVPMRISLDTELS